MTQFTTDRRTIVKGAAWTIPAVSVAAAAPALAASPTCDEIPQDLSTSSSAGGTRTSPENLNINPSTFRNTGTESVEGITVTFVASGTQTIEGISVFGSDIKDLVPGATTSGYGTNTVVLTLPPGTGLGQVSIPPGGEYTAPLGQDLALSSPEAFTVNVTVQATNGTDCSVPFEASQEVPEA